MTDLRTKNHKSLPIQYQKGYVEFYKLKFKVTPDVLIPRPETELLVDEVLNYLRDSHPSTEFTLSVVEGLRVNYPRNDKEQESSTILDIGTGAGNIAISLAKNIFNPDPAGLTLPTRLPTRGVQIIATDIFPNALKIAKQNARLHNVEDKIEFIQSDLLTDLNYNLSPKPYTLILVTNLPYIPSARIPYLDSSVKDFEPKIALDGGEDGFELYRELFSQISTMQPRGLQPKLIIGEIDYTHGELAVNEALKFFPNVQVEVKTDLAHKQRILKIIFP